MTARRRTASSLTAAAVLTALLGWELAANRPRRPAPAGEGTLAAAGRLQATTSPSAPSTGTRSTPPTPLASRPAAGTPAAGTPDVPAVGSGRLEVVPGEGPVRGPGRLRRYRVEVETGLAESPTAFAEAVERTLADPRGWGAGGRLSFRRVSSGPADFTVVLASPGTTDRLCRPLDTAGIYSCFHDGRAVVNYLRWRTGAAAYGDDLASYRLYVVLHEVGHALRHDHESCPAPGALAPTMMQQTKGVSACRANPWPYPEEED